MSKSCIL